MCNFLSNFIQCRNIHPTSRSSAIPTITISPAFNISHRQATVWSISSDLSCEIDGSDQIGSSQSLMALTDSVKTPMTRIVFHRLLGTTVFYPQISTAPQSDKINSWCPMSGGEEMVYPLSSSPFHSDTIMINQTNPFHPCTCIVFRVAFTDGCASQALIPIKTDHLTVSHNTRSCFS